MLCAGPVVFILGVCLFSLCLCLAVVDCSTLGTAGVSIVGICCMGCVIDLVWRVLLLLVFSSTIDFSGSDFVVVGVPAIYVLC